MRLQILPEPELEFAGQNRHVDVRFGIQNFGPFDLLSPRAPHVIRLAVVGTAATIAAVEEWIESCRAGVPQKDSKLPNLFPAFPGFGPDSPFASSLVLPLDFRRELSRTEIDRVLRENPLERTSSAVDLFVTAAEDLVNRGGVGVVIVAPPGELLATLEDEGVEASDDADADEEDPPRRNEATRASFHDLLKARGLRLPAPIQMVRPETYGGRYPSGRAGREVQDGATRAWNFHVALYYKAGGTPWRLPRPATDLTACYVGVGFYRAASDEQQLHTSVAQVFNERGEGMVVRGGPGRFDKNDRQVHLSADDAAELLRGALAAYRREHRTLPARVVVHKTSRHNAEESRGFKELALDEGVEFVDLVSVSPSTTRLFRPGEFPPLRGTLLVSEAGPSILYTRGSVEFFRAYPGMYIPQPMRLGFDEVDRRPEEVASEVLALTKMNWNNTQFDGWNPITISAARRASTILRHVAQGSAVQSRYGFYM